MTRTRRSDVAEELVQETFLAALANRAEFEGRSAGTTWLIGILRNKIADYYRRRAREERPNVTSTGPDADEGADTPLWSGMFTDKGMWRPEQVALARRAGLDFSDQPEFLQDLERCAEGLPESLWRTFLLREGYAVSTEELCKQLEITPTNLWTRLHRARAALRACLVTKGWWKGTI